MQKKDISLHYQTILSKLLQRPSLQRMHVSQKVLRAWLQETGFRGRVSTLLQNTYDCESLLECCLPVMQKISEQPEQGWLPYIYNALLGRLFPEQPIANDAEPNLRGGFFYLIVLRALREIDQETGKFEPSSYFAFATPEEMASSPTEKEYKKLMGVLEQQFIIEMMVLGRSVMPFDLLGHVAGVHHIAMHGARQLVQAGVDVDIPLISAAAAMHDIGKYGCKGDETRRIPYLHYYYTEEWLKRYDLESISHVAANHSTWDLELENLPVEMLLLIYADFRAKSIWDENNREVTVFYTLKDAYDVILNKLDNVDSAKRERYQRVYAKLYDFEQYMLAQGVNADPYDNSICTPEKKDAVLQSAQEAVQGLRFQVISHNLRLMRRISADTSFADLLEDARSEKDWKNIRTYIDIFEEYFSYMTQKQKLLTMRFLYELFMHTQGDIRSQASILYGRILANYDIVHRKELPKNSHLQDEGPSSLEIWKDTLVRILSPDHKLAMQQRTWINYALKSLLPSILANSNPEKAQAYFEAYLDCFTQSEYQDDTSVFVLLDSLLRVPVDMLKKEGQLIAPMALARRLAGSDSRQLQAGAMRLCIYLLQEEHLKTVYLRQIEAVLQELPKKTDVAVQYLLLRAYEAMPEYIKEYEASRHRFVQMDISELFLENLKTATDWVIKEVNIQLLLYHVHEGKQGQAFQVATHLGNLVRVSERFAVRHAAGRALVQIAPLLTLDQRNEVAVELTRSLENANYEFSKYIPEYLGRFLLYLHPKELDEVLREFTMYLKSPNEQAACVTLPTLGVLLQEYDETYRERFGEPEGVFMARKECMLSMLLGSVAHYSEIVSREAFLVIGKQMFGGTVSFERKNNIFALIHKKLLMLLCEQEAGALQFFNNAASLNHIYRHIIEAELRLGSLVMQEPEKVAFFPGTFDPFSMSHKGIVEEMLCHGYEVYLALDEFSWSKRTQPHMVRRRIVNMSTADLFNVYTFPDDVPVNIANPADLKRLRSFFKGRDVYIAVGSDVIRNASAYKKPPQANSIHSFHHIVFLRNMDDSAWREERGIVISRVKGKIHELALPPHLEDVSSTRIREYVDHNRDISTLVDPVAQGYIYDNGFYLREPQYKELLRPETLYLQKYKSVPEDLAAAYIGMAKRQNRLAEYPVEEAVLERKIRLHFLKPKAQMIALYRESNKPELQGVASVYATSAENLFEEFRSVALAEYARRHTSGRIAVLAGVHAARNESRYETLRMLVTEALAESLRQDYTYALYIAADSAEDKAVMEVLENQGFLKLPELVDGAPVFAVDMRTPVVVIEDVRDRLKAPFSHDEEVLRVLRDSQKRLAAGMTALYPGRLILSFNAGLMSRALIQKVLQLNKVEHLPPDARQYGECMCVPYGKPLHGVMVPNTVTKALHVDKTYMPDMKSFSITKYPGHSTLRNQVRTIKSFDRPVLLVDDLLHKGYRLEELDPLFKEAELDVRAIVVGVLSGRGKDLMSVQQRRVESVYFIPNLRYWFVDSMLYPFLGGDSVFRPENKVSNMLYSVNQVYPYTSPSFISGTSQSALFDLSLICLENAAKILKTLEKRHQAMFGFNLTLNRLGEATQTARVPDKGACMKYDRNLSPSIFVENDIEMLLRLESMIK